MTSLNINVLVSAKEEYLTQMINILVPFYRKSFKHILEKSQENVIMKYKLRPFQSELKNVQKWSDIALDTKVSELKSIYPYFYDLLKAIFVIHVKILSSIKLNPGGKEFNLEIPQLRIFIHRIFIETARKLYYNPNIILCENSEFDDLIYNVIIDTLRSLIPIQNILSEYLNDLDDEEKNDDDYHSVPDEEPLEEPENVQPESLAPPVSQPYTDADFQESPPQQLTPPPISHEMVPPAPPAPPQFQPPVQSPVQPPVQNQEQMPWQNQNQEQKSINPDDMMLPVLFNDAKSL